ncbi:zinc ribbon domain-containing protein [Nocardia sp. NBC_01388]|uniref:zinc ribbon domain-containing protein n=1 Tax=Nocardia sp. NBC_01388 TaxID=2903596 RepID=UPI0032563440
MPNRDDLHRFTPKLQQRLTAGSARILSAAVRHWRGRWFVAFQVETQREVRAPLRPDTSVGIDVGITHLAVLADSDGRVRYGAVKTELLLRVRVFKCDVCGLILDRDVNAAVNLVALVMGFSTGTGVAGDQDACASNPRGADRKTRATYPTLQGRGRAG